MDLDKAAAVQFRLAHRLNLKWSGKKVRTVAGADFSYDRRTGRIGGGIIVFDADDMREIDSKKTVRRARFPYVSGYLSFREAPAFFQAFRGLRWKPDVMFIDGNGIAHPRKMGLASFIGVVLDICTIGCAKSPVFSYVPPARKKGSMTAFFNPSGEQVGVCLRTRTGVKPIFVSPGHRIDIEHAVDWTLRCAVFRIPEPIREAHLRAKHIFPKNC